MKIHLLRHAKTNSNSESGLDIDRELLPKGVKQASLMSSYLEDKLAVEVHCSSSKRTRQTFDLVFKDNLKTIPYGPVVVFEVKQSKMTKSPIIDLLRAKKIPSLGISKYCLAVISLKENIKYNGFKSKLRLIRKYTENNINL